MERGKDVIDPGRWPHPPELGGTDLLVIHPEAAHEGGLASEGLQPTR